MAVENEDIKVNLEMNGNHRHSFGASLTQKAKPARKNPAGGVPSTALTPVQDKSNKAQRVV